MVESPFDTILHTNAVPADPQRIRDFLEGPQQDLLSLADEIKKLIVERESAQRRKGASKKVVERRQQELQDLDMQIKKLTVRRDTLTNFVNDHIALLSPARALPEDIVREIFVASLPGSHNRIASGKKSPLLLLQIFQAWKDIALQHPRLWDAIAIHISSSSEAAVKQAEIVEQWLARSKRLPLSISMAWPTCRETFDLAPLLAAVVADRTVRWKHLHLVLPDCPPSSLTPLSELRPKDVPLLESVVIKEHVWDDARDASHLGPASLGFLKTSSLRKLVIPSTLLQGANDLAPWGSLKSLKITMPEGVRDVPAVENYRRILEQCNLLESFTLSVRKVDNDNDTLLDRFSPNLCPSLKRLEFRGVNWDHQLVDFANSIISPEVRPSNRLKHLHFRLDRGLQAGDHNHHIRIDRSLDVRIFVDGQQRYERNAPVLTSIEPRPTVHLRYM
ncbi:hypothetical protein DFH06DRAFT_1415430 [Mycena polygramma]|nr:hypothetical protein DFH06DRAFT_1415430 [Mycena polygramma]